jgi:hypothetical protein
MKSGAKSKKTYPLFPGNILIAISLLTICCCAKQKMPSPVQYYSPDCLLLSGRASMADSITVVLTERVNPKNAPRAGNTSESILFGHLYQTLFTIDCQGIARPVLADRWSRKDNGRLWVFNLRKDAMFWDSSVVTARDVIRSWQHTLDSYTREMAGVDSVTTGDGRVIAGDKRTIYVYFSHPCKELPRVFSTFPFSVAKNYSDSTWPLGSGPYSIVKAGKGKEKTSIQNIVSTQHIIRIEPSFDRNGPVVRFLLSSGDKARDLLGNVVDVMLTSDPAVIDYAATRPPLTTIPLPWGKTYLLLSTSRIRMLRSGGKVGTLSTPHRERLARDAVRAEARGCLPYQWFDNLRDCPRLAGVIPHLPRFRLYYSDATDTRRVLYNINDPTARDLAERVVALAVADTTTSEQAASLASAVPFLRDRNSPLIADGVTENQLRSSLRYGEDFAYIISISARPADPCAEALRLTESARWLVTSEIELSHAIIPLVDTRKRIIVKRGRVTLATDWCNNILLVNDNYGR